MLAALVRGATKRELFTLFGLAVLMALCFLILTSAVWHANEPVGLDRVAERLGIGAGLDGPLGSHPSLARAAEQIGSPIVVGSMAAAVCLLACLWRDFAAGLVVVLAPALCFLLIEYVAKPAINESIPFGGRAYPSGHAAGVSAVVASSLILIRRRWGRVAAAAAFPLLMAPLVAVGFGSLGLDYHHYMTDVIGGALLGATVAMTLMLLLSLAIWRWFGEMTPAGSTADGRGAGQPSRQ